MTETTLVGSPYGAPVFIPSFGFETGTFTDEQDPRHRDPSKEVVPHLKWHVPLNLRGEFRPADLADYDPHVDYRTDIYGYVLCYATIKSGARQCKNRAVNRYTRCDAHGGELHPLDKVLVDNTAETKDQAPEEVSRYRQFLSGAITVDDLDDEELASQGFRTKAGSIFRPKNVPRDMAHAFTKAIYDRAHREFRSAAVKSAQVMAEIMSDKTNDPEVRLKAAKEIIERNLGRTPQVVAITGSAPWEEIFSEITSGSRESARQQRQITSERVENPTDTTTSDTVEAEVVDGTGGPGTGTPVPMPVDAQPETLTDARLFDRNPAVLAQTLEIPVEDAPHALPNVDLKIKPPDRPIPLRRQRIRINIDGTLTWRTRFVMHIYDRTFALGPNFDVPQQLSPNKPSNENAWSNPLDPNAVGE